MLYEGVLVPGRPVQFPIVDSKNHRIPVAPNLPANHPNGVWLALRETLLLLPNERGFADVKDFCRACDACSTVCSIIITAPDEWGNCSYLLPGSRPHSFLERHHPALPLTGCDEPTSSQA